MAKPTDQPHVKESKTSRVEEAQRVISEYANELREILRSLRGKLH